MSILANFGRRWPVSDLAPEWWRVGESNPCALAAEVAVWTARSADRDGSATAGAHSFIAGGGA